MFTIEIDCPPGSPRPSDLLPGVLEDTGIMLDAEKPQSMFFGNWEWVIPTDQETRYAEVRSLVQARITALYNHGRIRYGSW